MTSENKQRLLEQKNDFVKYCHILYKSGHVTGVGGNLSMRCGNRILMTPTGFSLRDVNIENVAIVDMNGKMISGPKPTKDITMHLSVLRVRSEINIVCHIHSAEIIALTTLMKPGPMSIPAITPGFVYLAYPLKLSPFYVPGSDELSLEVETHFSKVKEHALLLRNHGLITVGEDFYIALNIAEEIEEAAKIWLMTKGQASVISEEDIVKIKKL